MKLCVRSDRTLLKIYVVLYSSE